MYKILCVFIFSVVFAGTPAAVEVTKHLESVISAEVAKECASCKIDLHIHNPKIIDDISIPDKVISDRWKGQTNLILKVGGESRVVTVTIRWMDQVVVAKKNIKQSQMISKADVRVVEKDVTFLKTAYTQNIAQVVGMMGQRVFQRGQVIDEAQLKKPLAIRYGQPIKAVIQEGGLQLIMSAQAKGAGAIGDRIPVYLTDTRKRLSAVIVDKATVRIE